MTTLTVEIAGVTSLKWFPVGPGGAAAPGPWRIQPKLGSVMVIQTDTNTAPDKSEDGMLVMHPETYACESTSYYWVLTPAGVTNVIADPYII